MIKPFCGGALDPHYLAYFDYFNRELFYEAHDVLENLWLAQRGKPDDLYYKGLIQFAGAFVHLQKNRLGPAVALFNLARGNLNRFPPFHHQLNLAELLDTAAQWIEKIEAATGNPLVVFGPPKLRLETGRP